MQSKSTLSPYEPPVTNKMCMGYFTNWGIYGRQYQVTDLPADVLTHIHYAFMRVNSETFKIQLSDSWSDIDKRFTKEEESVFGPFPVDTWDMVKDSGKKENQNEKENEKVEDLNDYDKLEKEDWEVMGNKPYDFGFYGNFKRLRIMQDFKFKFQRQKLALVASVGGWTFSNDYAKLIGNQVHMNNFAQSCCDFMEKYGFNGIDLDFEYICFGPQGKYKHPKPEEAAQFSTLLTTLRGYFEQLTSKTGEEYSLSITTSADPDKMRVLDWNVISAKCDYIALMSYDYAGDWDDVSAHQTPLYYNPKDPRKVAKTFNIKATMDFLLEEARVPSEKICMGSPAYGRSFVCKDGMFGEKDPGKRPLQTFEKANLDYNAIVGQCPLNQFQQLNNYFKQNQNCLLYDDVSHAAYYQNDQDYNVVTYDSVKTLTEKCEWVVQKDLAGIFFWELSGDVRCLNKDGSEDPEKKKLSLVYTSAHYLRDHDSAYKFGAQKEGTEGQACSIF